MKNGFHLQTVVQKKENTRKLPAPGSNATEQGVGTEIWTMIEHPAEVNAICNELLKKYEVSPAACHNKVLAFLEELWNKGLIKVRK